MWCGSGVLRGGVNPPPFPDTHDQYTQTDEKEKKNSINSLNTLKCLCDQRLSPENTPPYGVEWVEGTSPIHGNTPHSTKYTRRKHYTS